MSHDLLVSVIIPVFNSASTAKSAIDSVFSQGISSFEIIVVDDGSTDSSFETLAEYIQSSELQSIKLLRQANGGAASARNLGISHAQGEFIAFIDSDDVWLENKLNTQLVYLQANPSILLVGCLTNTRGSSFHRFKRNRDWYFVDYFSQLLSNHFQTSTVLLRRSVLQAIGCFPVGQRYAEEGDLFLRVAAFGRCLLVNKVLVNYGGGKPSFGDSGLSANMNAMWHGELTNIHRARERGELSTITFHLLRLYSLAKYLIRKIRKSLRG